MYLFSNSFFKYLDKPYQGCSISESTCNKMLIKEGSRLAIELSNKIVVKIYPKGNRFDSSNVDPIKFWNHGFQIGKTFEHCN